MPNQAPAIPREGMFATVRNRRGVITGVEPCDGDSGRLHLVYVDYKDEQAPTHESLIWEIEPHRSLWEPTALPRTSSTAPMPLADFNALLRAARWSATMPFVDPDGDGPIQRMPISSPFHGALQLEDFQLVPLLKALRMPRVNLLIADDVGLGKTIEAGLILKELLLRRRIQRVLILTPAALRLQWRDEMREKFALDFDLVDRKETHALRRQMGIDANPWRAFSRIVTSYHYLRQPDVLEQFQAACHTPDGSPNLPWDLLIVDECHNFMPSPFGEDSELCRMLRFLGPQFEHKIFLSATPHNGHTRCFTGLLEILDPLRFSQTDELKPVERSRIEQVVIRRLKREINQRTSPPRFCSRRPPQGIQLELAPEEIALHTAFNNFRAAIKSALGNEGVRRRQAGSFAVEILGKRLLSCPTAFAESWRRCRQGLHHGTAADEAEVHTARRTLEREVGDDRETQSREATAAGVVGAWLRTWAGRLEPEIDAIDHALTTLEFDLTSDEEIIAQTPKYDARLDAVLELICDLLMNNGHWHDNERLVIFTEFKTTLDYLARKLQTIFEPHYTLTLFGGMDDSEREEIRAAFNDPEHSVRVLVATDAAAEGLNLQWTARYLLHFDCPWNPSRLEQRNGRLDRHGQTRDVVVHHFVSDQDQDLDFLAHVIRKANDIRDDLGSANELFDQAVHRRLVEGEDAAALKRKIDQIGAGKAAQSEFQPDATIETGPEEANAHHELQALARELDLDPEAMKDTLEGAMAVHAGRPQLAPSKANHNTWEIINSSLPGWSEIIDDSVRRNSRTNSRGPLRRLSFSPEPFLKDFDGRLVFTPRPDVLLMHLSDPMLQRALSLLTRRRYPGTSEEVSRWTVTRGPIPHDCDALVLLSLEELAVNDLRETFHHWIQTICLPVRHQHLQPPLPHRPAISLRTDLPVLDPDQQELAKEILDEIEPDLGAFILRHTSQLQSTLEQELQTAGGQAREQEVQKFRSREGEISTLITQTTMSKLEREIERLQSYHEQSIFPQYAAEITQQIGDKQAELERRKSHYQEIRGQLENERKRILDRLLPKRYSMTAPVQVFPITIELRLPGGAQ